MTPAAAVCPLYNLFKDLLMLLCSQARLLANLDKEFAHVQREHQLPPGRHGHADACTACQVHCSCDTFERMHDPRVRALQATSQMSTGIGTF